MFSLSFYIFLTKNNIKSTNKEDQRGNFAEKQVVCQNNIRLIGQLSSFLYLSHSLYHLSLSKTQIYPFVPLYRKSIWAVDLSKLADVSLSSPLFNGGFDNDLIMVGLWVVACGGCGLWARWWWCWVVGSDNGCGGVSGQERKRGWRWSDCNVSWVSILFYFFCFLVVDFIWFWLASGGWPPWLPLAPLWATAMTAKPPLKPQSNFRSKHLITTIRRMNNGAIFLSLSFLFYFSFPIL